MRLKQTGLIETRTVEGQVNRGFVSIVAKEMTEAVVVRILNDLEISIDRGDFLIPKNRYLNSENKDEIRAIFGILLQFVIEKVLPDIRPDLQKIIEYSIEKSTLNYLPYFAQLQKEIIGKTIDSMFNISHQMLEQVLQDDPTFDRYLEQFKNNLLVSISSLKSYEKLPELKHLSKEIIEDIKQNYINRLQQEMGKENDIVSKVKSKDSKYG
jgi:hypothetical protein